MTVTKTPVKHDGPSGILLADKQAGITSFDALGVLKKCFSTPKIGHTGTLDKFATGLLVVLAGRALKLSPWFLSLDKRYEGTIRFGVETDTLDPEGETTAVSPLPDRAALENALVRFRGNIFQKAPAYSALHINGKRAHELARAAKAAGSPAPEMPARPVTIYELTLLSYTPPDARIRVRCSGGTYIRSLARDIALEAGSRAHLAALRRTAVAGFSIEDAAPLSNPENLELRRPDREVFSLLGIPSFETDASGAAWLRNGRPPEALAGLLSAADGFPDGKKDAPPEAGGDGKKSVAVFGPGETLVALLKREEGRWTYGCVMDGDRADH